MASASRQAAQAAAAQVPNDDPYSTPSASPASMRSKRQLAAKGRPTPLAAVKMHDAAVKMGPPPAYKSYKPTQRTRGQQQCQAAVTPR